MVIAKASMTKYPHKRWLVVSETRKCAVGTYDYETHAKRAAQKHAQVTGETFQIWELAAIAFKRSRKAI